MNKRILFCFLALIFRIVGVAQQGQNNVSVQSITKKIKEDFHSDSARIFAVYDWVTRNISYDKSPMRNMDLASTSAEQILENRKGVCHDYAILVKAMLDELHLQSIIITGIAKAENIEVLISPEISDHAWNAVQLNGKWKLLDCTFAASLRTLWPELHPFFLNSPEQFIFSHFPDDIKWTFLEKKVTKEQFFQFPIIHFYFDFYQTLPAFSGRIITNDGKVQLDMGKTYPADSLAFHFYEIKNETISETIEPVFVLSSDNKGFLIEAPRKGKFILQVYKKKSIDEFLSKLIALFASLVTYE